MKLSKPGDLKGGWPLRSGITESGFAAYAQCWADLRGRVLRKLLVAMAAIAALAGSAALAAEPPELKPFDFLIGEWAASGSGQPGAGSGIAVFARGLQDQVILRNSYAEYPPADGRPASRHEDLMVIYRGSDAGARADYYDNERHVIHYILTSPAAGQAVFLSEDTGGGPRFRLTYTLEANGLLKGEFAIAQPGAHEAFQAYLTWESRKATGFRK